MIHIGSHDSAAYRVDIHPDLSFPSPWKEIRATALVFPEIRSRINQLTRTQAFSLKEQAALGVRALDLRFAQDVHGTLFASHTFATAPLSELAADLEHWTQPTLCFVRPDPNLGLSQDAEHLLCETLDKACPPCITLIWGGAIPSPERWKPLSDYRLIWYNVDTLAAFQKAFEADSFDASRDILCGVLTPQSDAHDVLCVNLQEYAHELNPWLREALQKRPDKPLAVLVDYAGLA